MAAYSELSTKGIKFLDLCKIKYKDQKEITPRDYFAAYAMLVVTQETQEMRVASFWDWVKQLMYNYLNFTFLHVEYVEVNNYYKQAAERAYKFADAMMKERREIDYGTCADYITNADKVYDIPDQNIKGDNTWV